MVLEEIICKYRTFPQVKGIALGGSYAAKTADKSSDIDLYIFTEDEIPLNDRVNLIKNYSSKYEAGGEYFGSGDEFWADAIARQIDVMFWDKKQFENSIYNVWIKHYSSNGYTTAFLYTLKNFKILYDTDNWLLNLKKLLDIPYPEELRQNIIKRNIMLLKDKPFASYYEQIEKALRRSDNVSVNHRTAAFLASYFDILFAINRLLHPGEKRLAEYARQNCTLLPNNFEADINAVLKQPNPNILGILDKLVLGLKTMLKEN